MAALVSCRVYSLIAGFDFFLDTLPWLICMMTEQHAGIERSNVVLCRGVVSGQGLLNNVETIYELQSKLLKRGYIGGFIGDYYRGY